MSSGSAKGRVSISLFLIKKVPKLPNGSGKLREGKLLEKDHNLILDLKLISLIHFQMNWTICAKKTVLPHIKL
jgi:hypothetical protein